MDIFYIHIHVFIYVHIYIYTHIHTHIRTCQANDDLGIIEIQSIPSPQDVDTSWMSLLDDLMDGLFFGAQTWDGNQK